MKTQDTLFNKSTGNKLEKLFHNLPEVFFWTVLITRFFIMIPLYMAARIHFDFLHYPILINAVALVSVFIVEVILTLPSLATPYFERYKLKKYRSYALRSTIIFGLFNQGLIIQSWIDIEMKWQALMFYSFVNIATIVLAEFIGVMIGAKSHIEEKENAEPENEVESVQEPVRTSGLIIPESTNTYSKSGLPQSVEEILNNEQLSNKDKGKLLITEGYENEAITTLLDVSQDSVYRWKRELKTNGFRINQN